MHKFIKGDLVEVDAIIDLDNLTKGRIYEVLDVFDKTNRFPPRYDLQIRGYNGESDFYGGSLFKPIASTSDSPK